MRKIIALLCTLALLTLPAAAEEALPQDVQTFFAALETELADCPGLAKGEVCFSADLGEYAAAMPLDTAAFALSRLQYDGFYYRVLDEYTAVTVCMLNGQAAAYILDLSMLQYIGGEDVTHAAIDGWSRAYRHVYPNAEAINGHDLVTTKLFDCIYGRSDTTFASDMLEYQGTVTSSHVFALGYRGTLQLFPVAAYDGASFDDKPLSAQGNHELSGTLALTAEYVMLMNAPH